VRPALGLTTLLLVLAAPGVAQAPSTRRTPDEWVRASDNTYLTFPEWWFLVYSPREYATWVRTRGPGDFPFLGHIREMWSGYFAVARAIPPETPVNVGYHAMVWVICGSTTVEYGVRSIYEGTVGRLTEATVIGETTNEDRLGARVAADYAAFLDVHPWYEFDYVDALHDLWLETPFTWRSPIRGIERRYALTTEYLAKAGYAHVLNAGTDAAYAPEISSTAVVVDRMPEQVAGLEVVRRFEDGAVLLNGPRYQAFTDMAVTLADEGIAFEEIAGNDGRILVSAHAPIGWSPPDAHVLTRQPISTEPTRERVIFDTTVHDLSTTLRAVRAAGGELEHVYDY
jgi:hypothetical protein